MRYAVPRHAESLAILRLERLLLLVSRRLLEDHLGRSALLMRPRVARRQRVRLVPNSVGCGFAGFVMTPEPQGQRLRPAEHLDREAIAGRRALRDRHSGFGHVRIEHVAAMARGLFPARDELRD